MTWNPKQLCKFFLKYKYNFFCSSYLWLRFTHFFSSSFFHLRVHFRFFSLFRLLFICNGCWFYVLSYFLNKSWLFFFFFFFGHTLPVRRDVICAKCLHFSIHTARKQQNEWIHGEQMCRKEEKKVPYTQRKEDK